MYTERTNDTTRPTREEVAAVCREGTGQLPACGVLSFPYVAMQGTDPMRYDDQEALRQGTLFPGLGPLLELMALDFAIDELGLYLTTHSDDKEALELYWSYIRLGQEGQQRYREKCGPLLQTDITPGGYTWLNDPWPWDLKGE